MNNRHTKDCGTSCLVSGAFIWHLTLMLLFTLSLTACGSGGGGGGGGGGGVADSTDDPDPTVNNTPVISGIPAGAIVQDAVYSFTPSATDPEGDSLSFSISNLPDWLTFDSRTGSLSGIPTSMDLGVHRDITVTVSDGLAITSLPAFNIEVISMALGSVILSWVPPTENADGSALDDLAGYLIHWGTQPGNYPNSIEVKNPGISSYVVENLPPGSYFFAVTAVDTSDNRSVFSTEASRTVL